MGAYNFKAQFVPFVQDGRKAHTIRAHRRHPDRVGSTLYLYTGLRRKGARRLRKTPCVRIEKIHILPGGRIMLDGAELSIDEREALARSDGFADRRAMMEFWKGRLPFSGSVIHWENP
jgi:hypothetical protein